MNLVSYFVIGLIVVALTWILYLDKNTRKDFLFCLVVFCWWPAVVLAAILSGILWLVTNMSMLVFKFFNKDK